MFLGDAVGYGASPNECLKLIHRLASRSLMGNHDYAALGLMEADYFNQYAREEYREFIDQHLQPHARVGKGFKMNLNCK